jgi:hypothetical protein
VDIATVEVKTVERNGGADNSQQVLVSTEEGIAEGDGDRLKLRLPVRKSVLGGMALQTLEADLTHVEAYAGTVKYVSSDGSFSSGDMILVRYRSGFSFH